MTLDDDATADAPPLEPHSVANRLVAAQDLLESEHVEAGSAILAALLRHDEATESHAQLIELSIRALREETPSPGLVTATSRAALSSQAPGPALLDRLVTEPMAAYALHDVLHEGAVDRRRPEHHRVRLLEAWLGIWAATHTAPDPAGLQTLMHIDPALLPLAACRLAGLPDPVSSAATFLATHPPLETTSAVYGQALLDLVGSVSKSS